MRQADVLSRFLHEFDKLYPKLAFRSMRRVSSGGIGPSRLQLQLQMGASATASLDILAVGEGGEQAVLRALERLPQQETRAKGLVPTLLAPQMSPEGQQACEQANVGWLDLTGNAHIETESLFYVVERHKPEATPSSGVHAPFEGKAERVARTLLMHPRRRWRMRELAAEAHISLGLASMVTTTLAEDRLVVKSRDGLQLFDPGGLLESWAQAYDIHRSVFRVFRANQPAGSLLAKLHRGFATKADSCALTLWSAACSYLPSEVSPHRLALYWDGVPDDIVSTLELDEERGDTYVFVFNPYDQSVFWGAQTTPPGIALVHPCQLYLDLGCGDEQEIALAQRVRAKLLGW
ncbi:MAG: type IV toxin-antitoxin system AbiEi family antitoxin [Anaerolineae bacterium]